MNTKNLDELSEEACTLYSVVEPLLTSQWMPLESLAPALAPLARWLPAPSWKELWEELGAHSLVAHRVQGGTECVSTWSNRFSRDETLLSLECRMGIAQHYHAWVPHQWDFWGDFLEGQGIHCEAFWQLNHALTLYLQYRVLESSESGKYLRGTNENLSWIYKVASTTRESSIL